MNLKKLQERFYYVEVKDKYDVIRASDLLEKINVDVFGNDESKLNFLKNNDDIKNNYMIKNDDGTWRIQSHFIATDNTIDELEKAVKLYLSSNERKNLKESEKIKCKDKIFKISEKIDKMIVFLNKNYHNYDDLSDIEMSIEATISYFVHKYDLSDIDYSSIKESDINSFNRAKKLSSILKK